jgi:hypothetical protein
MTTLCIAQRSPSLARMLSGVSALALAVLWHNAATATAPTTAASDGASSTLPSVAVQLEADYRQQQWQRLSAKSDRDSLISAILIGLPTESQAEPMDGQAGLEKRLAETSPQDPLALFVLALACQAKPSSCLDSHYYDALVRQAPDNAVHWLLLPAGESPSDSQLHRASLANFADSHTRELSRIVRAALGELPIVVAPTGIDPRELALLQRRNTIDGLAYPSLAGVMAACRTPGQPNSADCISIARKLVTDRSGSILPTMVGSAMIRRLRKGTPEAAAAVELRRDYVWLSIEGPLNSDDAASEEAFRAETAQYGEWEAWRRRLERQGSSRKPPSSWTPPDPQVMLLAEERTPATQAK